MPGLPACGVELMATINKSDRSADRRGPVGKGDFHAGPMGPYRDGDLWGKSVCCDAPILRIRGGLFCESCDKPCTERT